MMNSVMGITGNDVFCYEFVTNMPIRMKGP